MRRLLLAAALVFALLPFPAAAESTVATPAMQAPQVEIEAPSRPYPGQELRAGIGFQLVTSDVRRIDGRSRGVLPPVARAGAAPLAFAAFSLDALRLPSPPGAARHCERLPYRTTAPPLLG